MGDGSAERSASTVRWLAPSWLRRDDSAAGIFTFSLLVGASAAWMLSAGDRAAPPALAERAALTGFLSSGPPRRRHEIGSRRRVRPSLYLLLYFRDLWSSGAAPGDWLARALSVHRPERADQGVRDGKGDEFRLDDSLQVTGKSLLRADPGLDFAVARGGVTHIAASRRYLVVDEHYRTGILQSEPPQVQWVQDPRGHELSVPPSDAVVRAFAELLVGSLPRSPELR